jgi:hypothetical protein
MTTIHPAELDRVMGGVAPATDPNHTRSKTLDPDGYAAGVRQNLRDGLGAPGSNAGDMIEFKGSPTPDRSNPYAGGDGTDV